MRNWAQRIRRRAPFAVFLCIFAVASTASATSPCTKVFIPGNTTWHLDENWIPEGVPGPNDYVCILAGGSYEITVSAPVTIAGLLIDPLTDGPVSLKIIDTLFTLNGPGYLAGSTKLKVNDGAVLRSDVPGTTIDVHSKLVIEGGTVEIDIDLYGHLNWWGEASVTGVLTTFPGSVIEVEDPKQPAHLTIANGLENHGSMVFYDTIDQSVTVTGGAFVNSEDGTISTCVCSGSGSVTPQLRADLHNDGLIDVDGVGLLLSSDGAQHEVAATGTIQVADAELEIELGDGVVDVPSNFTNYGSITVAGGGSIRVNGTTGAVDVPSNFTNYGSITVAGGGSIRVNGTTGDNAPMATVNFGLIDLLAGGNLTLVDSSFDNPASGQVMGAGTLDLTAAAGGIFDGILSPGASPGILLVDGSLAEGPSAQIIIEVGGESPGVNLDRLDVMGDLTADGTLHVDLLNPYHPEGGEQYEVLTFGQFLGGFDIIEVPPLLHHLVWNIVPTPQALWLEIECHGTQLGIDLVADNDPVSVGGDVTYFATVTNHSSLTASDVVVIDALPGSLIFKQVLSSPECVAVGSAVECTIAALAPGGVWNLTIVAEAVVAGPITNVVVVDSWECDRDITDNQGSILVNAVLAEPCDANYDFSIDADDVGASVHHIFGETAPGNPDCRIGGGVTADDLSATIEATQ